MILLDLQSQIDRIDARIRDLGPWYAETNLDHFIVEPWNGLSSLTFLIPAIYWLFKFRGHYREKWFYVYCASLLIIGGLGSTIYHLFRYYPFFIFMDSVPIIILTLSIAIFLWNKVLKSIYLVTLLTISVFALRYYIHTHMTLTTHAQINLGYFITGTFFFLPSLILLIQERFVHFQRFALALLFLIAALVCRVVDVYAQIDLLPMGTHFLWHIFCAVGAFYLGEFIVRIDGFVYRKSGDNEDPLD